MRIDGVARSVICTALGLAVSSITLVGCSRKAPPQQQAAQAPARADTTGVPVTPPSTGTEYGSSAASDAISERSRRAEAPAQPASAAESTSVTEVGTDTPDDNAPSASPAAADASPPDSTVHHQVVPRKSRRPGGH